MEAEPVVMTSEDKERELDRDINAFLALYQGLEGQDDEIAHRRRDIKEFGESIVDQAKAKIDALFLEHRRQKQGLWCRLFLCGESKETFGGVKCDSFALRKTVIVLEEWIKSMQKGGIKDIPDIKFFLEEGGYPYIVVEIEK